MKKWTTALLILTAGAFSGCASEEAVEPTITYENESLEYEEAATNFVNEVPDLLDQAVTDDEAADALETHLESMRLNIEEFNSIQEPENASDLHAEVVSLNNEALEDIELYQASIEDSTLDPSVVEDTDIFQTLSEIVAILDEIQELES